MASAWVQAWQGNSSAAQTTTGTITVSGATANNLLVAVLSLQFVPGAITDDTGNWTKIQEHDSGTAASGCMFYRIASGDTNDNFDASWVNSEEWACTISEYSGLDATSPLETSAENTTYVSSTQSAGVNTSSGSATPSTQPGRAITGLCNPDSRDGAEGEFAPDTPFALDSEEQAGTGNTPSAFMGSDDYAATSAQEASWNPTLSSDYSAYTMIANFKEAGGGGGLGIPIAAYHFRHNIGSAL